MYYVLLSSFGKDNIESLRAIKEHNDVTFSAHLPLWSIEPASHIEKIRQASVSSLIDSICGLEELKPDPYVLHATGPLAAEFNKLQINQSYKRLITEFFYQNAKRSVMQIIEHMSDVGILSNKVALESVEFPFLETVRLAEEFGTSICIDTGHILAGYHGDVNLEEAMRMSAGRLKEIHLHDAYRKISSDYVKIQDHYLWAWATSMLKYF